MSTTIAYNHKGGYWKTRYTFFASFMRSVGRRFFSSPSRPIGTDPDDSSVVDNLVWQHNSDSDTNRTNFYGSVGGSGISVSFNDNVSSNKIYKSFSLEGTNNISGVNTFVVNSDNSPDKQFSMGPIKDKGGILYGHIGLSNTVLDGSNIKVLGVFDLNAFAIVGGGGQAINLFNTLFEPLIESSGAFIGKPTSGFLQGINTQISRRKTSTSKQSKLIIQAHPSEGSGVAPKFFSIFLNPFNLSSNTAYSDVPGPPVIFEDPSLMEGLAMDGLTPIGNFFDVYFKPVDGAAFEQGDQTLEGLLSEGYSNRVSLFEITPQEINGAPPRGQYAQAEIALGSAPYELFSLNVNYEPTDLDHSK